MAWKAGQSGNPKGRKPGSGVLEKLRRGIASDIPQIVSKLAEQAKAGDVGAARLLLERVLPPLKAAEAVAPIVLPEGSLTEQGRAVLIAAAAGKVSPGQAAQLLTGLGSMAKIMETDELVARIKALEDRDAQRGI